MFDALAFSIADRATRRVCLIPVAVLLLWSCDLGEAERLPKERHAPNDNGMSLRAVGDSVVQVASEEEEQDNVLDVNPDVRTVDVGPVQGGSERVYLEHEVDVAAERLNTVRPLRPHGLRGERLSGTVVVQFVVDTAGRVVSGSSTTLEAPHELLARSVEDVISQLRFAPARAAGKKVHQLVQQRFIVQ